MDDMFPAEALIAMERRLGTAVRAGDATTVDLLLHPDFVSVRPDGRRLDRREVIERMRAGGRGVDHLVTEETIATVNGRTGITRRLLTTEGVPSDRLLDLGLSERVLCIRTWVEKDGTWLLLTSRVCPAPPEDHTVRPVETEAGFRP
ncbi:nuclear transport factor 2 family protein [Streptomyces sp. NPDC002851]